MMPNLPFKTLAYEGENFIVNYCGMYDLFRKSIGAYVLGHFQN